MGPQGVRVGDETVGGEALPVLGLLLVGQLDPPAHEVDEYVEAVLLEEGGVEGPTVLPAHLVTLIHTTASQLQYT